jgi:hypothetical protein
MTALTRELQLYTLWQGESLDRVLRPIRRTRYKPARNVSWNMRWLIMGVAIEHCTLISDGKRLEKVTCAFEMIDKAGTQPYGFLSGP